MDLRSHGIEQSAQKEIKIWTTGEGSQFVLNSSICLTKDAVTIYYRI